MISNTVIFGHLLTATIIMMMLIIPFFIFRKTTLTNLKQFFVGFFLVFLIEGVIKGSLLNLLQNINPIVSVIINATLTTVLLILGLVYILRGVSIVDAKEKPIQTATFISLGYSFIQTLFVAITSLTNFDLSKRVNNGTLMELVSDQITSNQLLELKEQLINVHFMEILASMLPIIKSLVVMFTIVLLMIKVSKATSIKAYLVPATLLFSVNLVENLAVASSLSTGLLSGMMLLIIGVFGYISYLLLKEKKKHGI